MNVLNKLRIRAPHTLLCVAAPVGFQQMQEGTLQRLRSGWKNPVGR